MAIHLTAQGPSALSEFRRLLLASQIGAKSITAQYLHHIALDGELNTVEASALGKLLDYGEVSSPTNALEALCHYTIYIFPRMGTMSPWSSKATSIAHVCGLKKIRRIERGTMINIASEEPLEWQRFADSFHDRMTQTCALEPPDLNAMFGQRAPAPAKVIDLHQAGVDPRTTLENANRELGLALDASEVGYLLEAYTAGGHLNRSPSDVELFMFAQVNSEHCRHKKFNANWVIDGVKKPHSLFDMIRNTYRRNPTHVISAYSDNAAVLEGHPGTFLAPNRSNEWTQTKEQVHYLAKVETHNHPTAVSPYPGAATGSGGEIRDEGAVGRGSKPKSGLCGFSVSDLLIPAFPRPWELDRGKPHHIASSLDIMLEAPIGSAAFNNEFGRPCTVGYFRTLSTELPIGGGQCEIRGYHKPIMLAGGIGTVRPQLAIKQPHAAEIGAYLIVLGGPAMLIGLGGGAASSVASGDGSIDLDFASVQRGNAEVQRRAQEVINSCNSLGAESPIQFIHDVGAGGLSNALPELANDVGRGATFELREIDNADSSMSPLQIWCCEAQERYVMAVSQHGLGTFKTIANRERCGFSIVGRTNGGIDGVKRLVLMDRSSKEYPAPINLPMSVLFGKPPKMTCVANSRLLLLPAFDSSLALYLPSRSSHEVLRDAVDRVLTLPAVGSKSFLITIGDRTVGGLTARDQMVGPWQTPVADVSVTATSLTVGIKTGEAMAIGEKPTLALISPAASARMAVAESLMNVAAAEILDGLDRVRLSANWMCASNHPGEGAALYEAVEAIGIELCPQLGISIPVGKDSMSMKMTWSDGENKNQVTAPLSVVISAFAPVADIAKTWTPTLRRVEDVGETVLLFVDLARGRKSLGGSALAQVFGQIGNECPDVHEIQLLRDMFDAFRQLREANIVLAYHDRSDGGLFTTLVEMMFAGRCGLNIILDQLCASASTSDLMETLFNEELGAVFQVRTRDVTEFHRAFATCGPPPGLITKIGRVSKKDRQDLTIYHDIHLIFKAHRSALQQTWASTSYHMQALRDRPSCAAEEHASILDSTNPGLSYQLAFDPKANILPTISTLMSSWALTSRPRVAILREQGVNGQAEMAFAFLSAGFSAVDVHMTDLLSGRVDLASFRGLAACGGFSYGDVLGAGQGWAKSVLLHSPTRAMFQAFFQRADTFTLGVCNGCQFLSRLKSLIPGAEEWPTFERNASEQYEARVSMVELLDRRPGSPSISATSPSVFMQTMAGSKLPIATAHGEGRAHFEVPNGPTRLLERGLVALRYLDNRLEPTEAYPANPNGSPLGIAGVRTPDGRVLALMPHPERTVLAGVASWIPDGAIDRWGALGPWARLFYSARKWVG